MKSATQTELAAILGLSTRQIRNLEAEGMPHEAVDGRKRYPLPGAVHWWADRRTAKALESAESSDLDRERTRLVAAQARRAELELATAMELLMPVEMHEEQVAGVMATLRARVVAVSGSWPMQLEGRRAREIHETLRTRLVPELIADLRSAALSFADGAAPDAALVEDEEARASADGSRVGEEG